ncbi:MAG: DUF433 domain-containing protein [Myxococcales bacterium]|nr:DUF433 domain-containing protein [Myxococcales bacterium]MCB9581036.1 DUF433 domain-containing protein [Polyangiaceae bacterium]
MSLPIVLIPHPHVRVDPKVLGGSPHVAGSRVPVRRLWAFYESGARIETILRRYPQLGPAKIFDALAFALDNVEVIEADLAREREMLERTTGKRVARPGATQQIELPFGEGAPARGPRPRPRRSSKQG